MSTGMSRPAKIHGGLAKIQGLDSKKHFHFLRMIQSRLAKIQGLEVSWTSTSGTNLLSSKA
eukprot:119163-Pelagomonas_calceolata.AAC.4